MTNTLQPSFSSLKRLVQIACLLVFPTALFAQTSVTNQGTFYVGSSTDTLYINGTVDNQSSADFRNNGHFALKGDLNNDQATMTVGTGRLVLNGSSAQTVTGAQPFYTYNLTTSNSSGITLNNSLSITNVHTFSSGIISTNATSYVIYESGATYSGDGNSKHISGWTKKLGTADFDFPVGNGTVERKAGIRSLTASSDFQCHYYQTTPNTNLKNEILGVVNPNEYWYIDRNSGGSARVYMSWDISKVSLSIGTIFLSAMQVAHFTSSMWQGETTYSSTGSLLSTGGITSGLLNSFSPFTFGSGINVLPVSIQYLQVKCEENQHYNLSWLATHDDGDGVYQISYVNGNGGKTIINTVLPQKGNNINYNIPIALSEAIDKPIFSLEYLDAYKMATNLGSIYADCNATPISGNKENEDEINGYRISLLNSLEAPAIQFQSMSNAENTTYALEIYNTSGQLVKPAEDIEVMAGSNQIIPIDFPFVPQAMYFAVISSTTNNKKKKTFKIILK